MRWSKKEVIYQILVDRFSPVDAKKAKKPVFAGGTLKGITSKLNYFCELGVSAIWLSPITQGTTYHGYHTTDFMKVDPHFGSMEDFRELIKKFHEKKIKIILDFVPNHISAAHPFFVEANHKKNKQFRKWFYINSDDTYTSFFDYKELPKLNLDNEMTRMYITTVAKFWLSMGVDGLRLDHAVGPSLKFWKSFKENIKQQYPHSILLGEVWVNEMPWKDLQTTHAKNKLVKWAMKSKCDKYMVDYQEVFDGCLDFTFNKLLREYILEHEDKEVFAKKLHSHYLKFNKDFLLPTFIDNHDMDRFYFDCKGKTDYKKAIDMQFAQHQPTIIYYGDESGMSQEKSKDKHISHGDLEARQGMNWNNMDSELVEYYKNKISKKLK